MPKYSIPDRFKDGFEILLSLTQEQVSNICSVLKKIPVGTGYNTFQKAIISGINIDNSEKLSRTLFSFGELLEGKDNTPGKLSQDIAESFNDGRSEKLSDEEIKQLKKYLEKVFENSINLKTTYKVISLIRDNDKVFKEVRIISDIRLIFGEDISKKERNSMIIHRLKLEYEENQRKKEFYLSLDNLDLKSLKTQIDRALRKEELMRENYKESMTFIDVTD